MEEYRNILANKFMRDTNYIIIKDTDDLEELERQWELFQSSLTVRQQRLSDDRSIQIWNMTNQQHYEALKVELMGDLQNKLGIEDDEPTSIEYEPDDDEKIDDSEITNFVNMSFDDFEIPDDENEINEPIKEAYDKSNEEQKKVIELDKFMRKNIKYGVFDRYTKKLEFNMYSICYSGRWLSNYKFLTPEEVEKLGGGQCVDQANYAHHKLLEAGIDNSIYFILGVHDVLKFDAIAHAFVLVKFSNGQYAYFDNASSGKTTIFKTYKDTIRYAKNVLRGASQHIYLKFNLYDVTDCMPSYGSNFYNMLDELLSNGTLIESEISDRYGNFDAAKMDYYESRNIIDFQMLKYKSMKEESIIPTDGKELNEKQKLNNEIKADMNKDAQADQYEIDSNINIIGSIKGFTPQERLDNLERAFRDWNSQNQDHRKKSDDKCREIYGMSNIDRYKKLKGIFVKMSAAKTTDDVSKTISNSTNSSEEALSEFTLEVYRNMQVVNEAESNKAKQHRRLNDTPYFTPSEMIDMGVHGNHNYYCKDADNDGLITRVRIPTWFDSYKDMCMDHIFEDYTKDWIDTLDYLYSDFEEIKESGNEEKILARKQSILDLGWNPEIPFTRRNRQLASKRVSKLLDKSSPLNIFINLDKEVPDSDVTDEPVVENAHKNTHQPVYIVFVQGSKGLLVPDAIRAFTNSDYTHVGMSFDSSLKDIHTYNITANPGIVRETLSRYQDNIISVMAFFAPTEIYNNMKDEVMDHYINARKSIYDLTAIVNKVVKKNTRLINNKYHQICSTFVDTILRSGQIDITKDNNLPDPGQLYNITKSMPNKIIEVYNGPASGYNAEEVNKKMNKLLKDGIKAIDESKLTDSIKRKKSDIDLEVIAKTYDALGHLTRDEKTKADMKKKANTVRSMKGLLDFDEESINERYIFSEPDYQINIDKWGPGNPLWITGTSGDGKSTLCNKMAKERSNSLIVHTDTFLCRVSFTKEKYESKRAKWVNNETVGDEMSYEYIDMHPELEYDMKDKNRNWISPDKFKKYFTDYAYWIMEQAKTNPNYKNKNIIVEGCDICLLDPELMSTKPVIVIGGSRLRTAFRRVKRNIQTDNMNIIEAIFKEIQREKSYVNRLNKNKETFLDNIRDLSVNEGISDLDSAESNDIYHNIEDWESGKSNVLWVTGLSGSGKSTISKEISAKYNDVEYVELDLIQAGKIKQWDDNDKRLNGLLKDFVKYKGGFDNIFPSYTQKARKGELNFGDMMDKSCADQFNELFEYIITYTKKNSNRRFVIEGIQIAMCTSNKMIDKISKYPVIIKMNGPLKTEFRREKRSIKSHIDQDMDFITTFKHVCHHIQTWVKNGFFLNNWKELNYFRTHIGESASVLNEVKQFPVEFDQDGNLIIYKVRIGSIAYGDEIDDSVKLLESYRNTNNIEGMKYELAKLWFINDSIEKKLKKKLTNDQYKELIDNRATCLNVFKLNLEYVMKAEKGFNFSDYYNSTPFSDNSVKITANTLKYSMKAIANMI